MFVFNLYSHTFINHATRSTYISSTRRGKKEKGGEEEKQREQAKYKKTKS